MGDLFPVNADRFVVDVRIHSNDCWSAAVRVGRSTDAVYLVADDGPGLYDQLTDFFPASPVSREGEQ